MTHSEKEENFLSLLASHKNQIYRVCWGFCNNKDELNDLYQESMFRIWKALGKFKGHSQISTWAYRITVNTCIYWKKEKQRKLHTIIDEKHMQIIDQPIEENDQQKERILQLRTAIQKLNKIDRSIILLVLEGCRYKDIAEILGISTSNVGVKINRIKSQLRKEIENKNK